MQINIIYALYLLSGSMKVSDLMLTAHAVLERLRILRLLSAK